MTACVINGERCTKCCQAIVLPMALHDALKRLRGRRKSPDEINDDLSFVAKNWTPISRRRAKKINPYLINRSKVYHSGNKKNKGAEKMSFWVCNRLTKSGCSIYESRPKVCSDYPVYPFYPESYIKSELAARSPEYHPECTEWPKIDAVNI